MVRSPAATAPCRGTQSSGRWVFYFDAECGMCRRVVSFLQVLDYRGSVAWVPFQSLREPPGTLGWRELYQAVCLDRRGAPLLTEFFAFRALTLHLPVLWALAPLFYFPGMYIPGRLVYGWVAANRHRFSRCSLSVTGGSWKDPLVGDCSGERVGKGRTSLR